MVFPWLIRAQFELLAGISLPPLHRYQSRPFLGTTNPWKEPEITRCRSWGGNSKRHESCKLAGMENRCFVWSLHGIPWESVQGAPCVELKIMVSQCFNIPLPTREVTVDEPTAVIEPLTQIYSVPNLTHNGEVLIDEPIRSVSPQGFWGNTS